MLGDKSLAKGAMRDAGMPLVPGSGGPPGGRGRGAARRRRGRLPRAAQGGLGRRRARHAPGRRALRARGGLRDGDRRGRGGLRRRRAVPREDRASTRTTSRCRCVGDGEGGALVVGERECSVQRRHQKLLEESPSPFLSEETRQALYAAALGAVRATRYRNAGTIECLLGGDQSFYFMEMNTRLQVEHPVSEEVTGIDLVRTQLRLAMGEPLPAQGIAPTHGHAIEFRINAEDPSRGFLPSPGPLRRFRPPLGRGVRVDTHAYEGYTVPPTYDSLVAKLIVSDDDARPGARRAPRRRSRSSRSRASSTTLPLFREMVDERADVPRRACTRPPTSRRRRGGYPRCPRDDRYPAARGLAAPGAPCRLRPDLPARRARRLGSRRAGGALPRRHRHGRAGLHARGRRGRAARPRRDRRGGRRRRGRLDRRSPGRRRARDPAARDLGAAPGRAAGRRRHRRGGGAGEALRGGRGGAVRERRARARSRAARRRRP